MLGDCAPNDKPGPRRLQKYVADVVDIVICTYHTQTQLFQKTRRHARSETQQTCIYPLATTDCTRCSFLARRWPEQGRCSDCKKLAIRKTRYYSCPKLSAHSRISCRKPLRDSCTCRSEIVVLPQNIHMHTCYTQTQLRQNQ
jgi:hypothetical protein